MQLKFAVFNEENDFVYQKFSDNTFILTAASVEPSKGETDLVPNLKGGAHLLCFNGYIFITDFNTTKIIRLKIESYMYDNKKITMLSNNFYDFYLPFGCGYTIEQQFLSDDEMALAMLSQDKNYDIYFVNSAQSISENIKNKGAFYPLNEVEGVQKYLDACFSYIRDAATNSDGDIWMLPISVDIPVIFYNEKTCKEYSIKLSDSIDIKTLFATLRKLDQDEN